MSHVDRLIDTLGLEHSHAMRQFLYVTIIIALGITIGWVVRHLVMLTVHAVVKVRNNRTTRGMISGDIMLHVTRFITPAVILLMIPWAFNHDSPLLSIADKAVKIWLFCTIALGLNSVLTFIWTRYDESVNTRNLPLRGILDTGKGIVWVITIIITASVLMDKSPASLLAGLGAFAAALMLIFKDSILGLVASVQLSQNDMVHVGDWIVIPSTPANGTVLDITLTTVKIRNWDNTIVTLPPYTLVSSSFQNWRGMTESGCRRIARSVIIESTSVRALTPDMVNQIVAQAPSLAEFVKKSEAAPTPDSGTAAVNGTIETNLGLFRAYLCDYILHNPAFSHDSQILVRTMDPTSVGIPLQLYCFTATTAWTAYEAIQSALFEHVLAMAPVFGLIVFNYSSGSDTETVRVTQTPSPSSAT